MLPRADNLGSFAKCNCSKSAIIFLQRKQTEILNDLHQEIAVLKRDNSDLKFKLFTKSTEESQSRRRDRQSAQVQSKSLSSNAANDESKAKIFKLTKQLEEANYRVNSLEKMLATMDKMVGDSTFLQVQAETQFKVQQIEMEALQKELEDLRMAEFKTVHPASKKQQCHTSRLSYEDEKLMKEDWEHRRRSLSTASSKPKTRRSSLSILPTNYKETVATLPPIQMQKSDTGTSTRTLTTHPTGIPTPIHNKNNYKNMKSTPTAAVAAGVGWNIGNLGCKNALS